MFARILVIDDLAPNRNLLGVKLSAEYYDLLSAESGEEGLKSLYVDAVCAGNARYSDSGDRRSVL